jgi:hypothetical protein
VVTWLHGYNVTFETPPREFNKFKLGGDIVASVVRSCVENDGFEILDRVFLTGECEHLIALLGPVEGAGRRNLLSNPEIAALAMSKRMLKLLQPYLKKRARPVRGIYFDKTPEANWSVTWHQDLLIPVRERIETEGFGPWSMKEGIMHVQPPAWALEQMLTIRLHLDDTDETNGALQVVRASHQHGVVSSEAVDELSASGEVVPCCVRAGGALLMRPLLLHSSRKTGSKRHRRVIHLEYTGCELPNGLAWHNS